MLSEREAVTLSSAAEYRFCRRSLIDGSAYPDALLRLQLQISQFLGYLVDDGWGEAGACLWKCHKN